MGSTARSSGFFLSETVYRNARLIDRGKAERRANDRSALASAGQAARVASAVPEPPAPYVRRSKAATHGEARLQRASLLFYPALSCGQLMRHAGAPRTHQHFREAADSAAPPTSATTSTRN